MKTESVSPGDFGSVSREALERLIYVVGSARGGTSLTKELIGLHDNVISFHGPTHFLNHPWRHRKRLEPRLWNVVYWLPSSVRRADARDSLTGDRLAAFTRHVNRVLRGRNFRDLYQLYPLVRAIDPEEPRDPDDIVAWLDKGNDFWGVDLIAQHFPQARFVFVVRDPRGSIASLAKRLADDRPDTDMQVEPRDVITSAIYWRNLAQQELRFARGHPDRTVFFRFEDVVTRPFDIVPRLYEFLGLPAVPEPTMRERFDGLVYSASLNPELGSGLSAKPVDRWRKTLSQEALDCIAEICGPTARRFGYELEEPARKAGMWGLAAQMPGRSRQATVLAKLAYLRLREAQLGGAPTAAFSPMRLIEA